MPSNPALDPENRRIYGEVLRPPLGYRLDLALATTFSMDFETAMVIPATMALHAAESRDETLDSPIALLEGLERMSERLAIFCDAGRIHGSSGAVSRLSSLLEDMVTEVSAPGGGAFHPKLWLMRFTTTSQHAPVLMRMALLSRNLTRDMSWDLCLVLDGERGGATRSGNAPISRLLRSLPGMAIGRPTPDRSARIARDLANDLAKTSWVLPDGFRAVELAVNGLGDEPWRPSIGKIVGIVSPFCDAEALRRLTWSGQKHAHLVSRLDELAALPQGTLDRFHEVSVLDEMAESSDEDAEEVGSDSSPPARGLHAKAIITQRYSTTHITVGSGNATSPALINGKNVEVFATL